jgi:hypothetical protein
MSVHREGETVNSRALITIMALVIGLAALSGCGDNESELQRLVCEVESVNDGVPLISAALNVGSDGVQGGDDDYVPIDFVPVVFRSRALSSSMNIPEDGLYSSFIITGYDLTWTSSDPNAPPPAELSNSNVTGGFASAQVPIDNDAVVSILVGPLEMKGATWFQAILNGSAPAFSASAQFVFWGHVSGTDHEVGIPAGLMVNFIGAVVE